MRFFWPNKLNPAPSGVTRFGRMLHWIGCATALLACLFGSSYFVYGIYVIVGGHPTGGSLAMALGIASFVAGIVIYFFGRTLRYIFSGE